MRERRFACVACGACCRGWLPLSLADALAGADLFPLAVTWSVVRKGARSYDLTAANGTTVKLRDGRTAAVGPRPVSLIPPSFPCPALTDDNLCGLQAAKPLRCRTMPLSGDVGEGDQAPLLIPRAGWRCDTSEAAPVVHRDGKVVDRAAFDEERATIAAEAPTLRAYAQWVLTMVPAMTDNLTRAAMKPGGGHVVVGFASLLRRLPDVDKTAVARAQARVLTRYAELTSGGGAPPEYHRDYTEWAAEMTRLVERGQTPPAG